jgi:hypothetical protein
MGNDNIGIGVIMPKKEKEEHPTIVKIVVKEPFGKELMTVEKTDEIEKKLAEGELQFVCKA